MALTISLADDAIQIGDRLSLSFQRTLRVPDDGREYPLPPSLGRLPIRQVSEAAHASVNWLSSDLFVPLYQREALWIALHSTPWKPHAVQVGVGRINAITGEPWNRQLRDVPQNYMVCPPQLWLDGINAGAGHVRQFVAMPLGRGFTVEAQLTGDERHGAVQITVRDPKPGRFPDQAPPESVRPAMSLGTGMGIAAGGRIKQKIYPDAHGLDTWDDASCTELTIHLVNSDAFQRLTGETMPPTPIDAKTYTEYGFPWFELLDEEFGDLGASPDLERVKSIAELERERGVAGADESSVEIAKGQIHKLK